MDKEIRINMKKMFNLTGNQGNTSYHTIEYSISFVCQSEAIKKTDNIKVSETVKNWILHCWWKSQLEQALGGPFGCVY